MWLFREKSIIECSHIKRLTKEELIVFMDRQNAPIPEYTTYPRKLEKYRWFKPLLTALMTFVLFLVLSTLIYVVCYFLQRSDMGFIDYLESLNKQTYESFNNYSATGVLRSMGMVAILLPSLELGLLVTKERSIKTVSSSRGGWNHKLFFICLGIGFIVSVIPQFIYIVATQGFHIEMRFELLGFLLTLILWPFQCIAEEYICRGFLMQTVSSWTRVPAIGVIISAAVFTAMHPYNGLGRVAIALMGVVLSFLAWYSFGLEVGSGIHVANNFAAFFFAGIGIDRIQTDVTVGSILITTLPAIIYTVLMVLLNRKYHWFDKSR